MSAGQRNPIRKAERQLGQRIGVISDTHGLLRPEALASLQGVVRIIHGGDIGTADIIERLSAIAPVIAVRGNNDKGVWADSVPLQQRLVVDGITIQVVHDLATLVTEPGCCGADVVVSGHSHRPSVSRRDGVLYLNPGSAGPRRFKLPISVAELLIGRGEAVARILELPVSR